MFAALAINAENAPQDQAVSADPFLRELAAQAFAGVAHVAPVLVIGHGAPRTPGCRRFEHTQLTRPRVKARQQETLDAGIENDRTGRQAVGVREYGSSQGEIRTPTRLTVAARALAKLVSRALTKSAPGRANKVKPVAASPPRILAGPVNVNVSGKRSGNAGIVFAEVKEFGRLKVSGSFGEQPVGFGPGRSPVGRPSQRMIHRRPGPVLQIDAGVKSPIHKSDPAGLALFRERRRGLRILSPVHVDAATVFRATFNASKAHTDAAVRVRPTEAAAIAPGGVKMVIRSPGHRPQIAARRSVCVRVPMPGDALDDRAGRVRRLR